MVDIVNMLFIILFGGTMIFSLCAIEGQIRHLEKLIKELKK
jgi:hypothetical protein